MTDAIEKKKIVSYVGRLGKKPERKTPKGLSLVEFQFAVPTGYDREDESLWFTVTVWNNGLQDDVLAELDRGMECAVRGELTSREYNGKTYYSIKASRIWLVQALQRSDDSAKFAPREAAAEAPAAPRINLDVLPF